MPRAPLAGRLRHILDAIARIEALTAGKSFEDYAANWMIRDAVERNLERVSEASRHIPSELRAEHTHTSRGGRSPVSATSFGTTIRRSRTGASGRS
jgi:uncharacterized protein with HEPN domain